MKEAQNHSSPAKSIYGGLSKVPDSIGDGQQSSPVTHPSWKWQMSLKLKSVNGTRRGKLHTRSSHALWGQCRRSAKQPWPAAPLTSLQRFLPAALQCGTNARTKFFKANFARIRWDLWMHGCVKCRVCSLVSYL